ncbi:hypothetical protein BB559_000571 [Furculomyces boomerangus]|uniref:Uncharacterized protein n=2 Tax=Harpellales TaxID=61421 RepID=A0A2T9Z4R8_9FUNG|nr:hypothetical protein BB559_000571 [Furculomyces boomerangus]PWA00930.1 hypothetical protein BB558_002989 [Smittium angustum]
MAFEKSDNNKPEKNSYPLQNLLVENDTKEKRFLETTLPGCSNISTPKPVFIKSKRNNNLEDVNETDRDITFGSVIDINDSNVSRKENKNNLQFKKRPDSNTNSETKTQEKIDGGKD